MTKEEAIKLIDDRMCFGRGKWSEHHKPEIDIYWQAGEMAIKALEAEPHWIPVTERLPKEDGNYLVSGKWGSGKEAVGDCLFSVEDGYFQTAWNFDVLAWCELPEPYRRVTT